MFLDRSTERGIESSSGADGIFNAVLATEGEASDGHILSIRGLQTQTEVPMLYGHHSSEQIPLVGTIRQHTKSFKGTPELRVKGQVNLNGDGLMSDIRRGIWQLIDDGDLRAMSIRAEVVKSTPRRNLARDHAHFVDASKLERNDPRAHGQLLEKSREVEGSVLALGSDSAALIQRADEAGNDAVKTFFRSMAHQVDNSQAGLGELGEAFSVMRDAIDDVKQLGVDDDELAEFLATQRTRDCVPFEYTAEDESLVRIRIPQSAYHELVGESREYYRGAMALHAEIERKLARELAEAKRTKSLPVPTTMTPAEINAEVARQMGSVQEAVLRKINRATGRIRR